MNDNTIEIISLMYGDVQTRGFSRSCSEVRHDRNRSDAHGRLGWYLNGEFLDSPETHDVFLNLLRGNVLSRSISIDSRFLNNSEVVSILASSPDLREVRITDEGYTLTNDVLNLFPSNISIVCDEVSDDVSSIDRSRVYTQHGLFKKETNYIEDDLVSGYFVTRELSDEEIERLVDIVNNDITGDYVQISFRVYNPAIYKDLVTKLRDRGLREDVRLNFLGYPLADAVEAFEGLNEISNNPISISYDTCSDMVGFYTTEPYSVSNNYHSELEGGGTTSFDSYFEMVRVLDEQERHIREHNYSPLEAAIYAYRFMQQNYAYDPNNDVTDAINVLTNRQLDLVATSNTMVCEGYATLYSALLRRCGIPMFRYATERHVRNIGRIADPKYGIDRIAVFDPTWDHSNLLADGTFVENNRFQYFMLSPREAVHYDPYVTIPTSLVLNYEACGSGDLSFYSKDPYEQDLSIGYSADGYAITMLDRMGIQIPDVFTQESYRGLVENLNNTPIFNYIDTNAFVEAYQNVLRSEHPELSNFDRDIYVLNAINSMRDRLNDCAGLIPMVTINYDPTGLDPYDIPAVLYPANNTLSIEDFNKREETNEVVTEEAVVRPQVLYGPRPSDDVVEEEVVTEETVVRPQVLYGPRPSDDVVEEEVVTEETVVRPQVLYGPRPSDDIISSDEVNEVIDDTMDNLDVESDEFIPGTRIRKPRWRGPYETDEEYVAYLAEYYGRYFPQAQQATRESTVYSLTRDQIIQDLPIHSKEPSRFNGVMTPEEIEESRGKLR